MKNSKVAAAMFALMISAASAALAGDTISFDGKTTKALSFAELLKTADPIPDIKAELVAPAGAAAGTAEEVRIDVTMKNGASETKETLLCQAAAEKDAVLGCRKQSDLSAVKPADVAGLALQRFYPDLMQTKHSYDGKNGPQTFHCDDLCARWTTVKRCITVEVGSGGLCVGYEEEQVCTDWTHSCECTSNCY